METKKKLSDKDFQFIEIDEAEAPTKGHMFSMYREYWWAVHPDKGLLLYNPLKRDRRVGINERGEPVVTARRRQKYGSPQCNLSENIVKRIVQGYDFEVQIIQIARAFVPIDINDYVS